MLYKFLNLLFIRKFIYIDINIYFFPIFEALGFNIINYIGFTVDGYGEGLSYFFLLCFIYFYILKKKVIYIFYNWFLSFLIIGLRPNYLVLLFSLMLFYSVYLFFIEKNLKKLIPNLFFMYFGASFFPFFGS